MVLNVTLFFFFLIRYEDKLCGTDRFTQCTFGQIYFIGYTWSYRIVYAQISPLWVRIRCLHGISPTIPPLQIYHLPLWQSCKKDTWSLWGIWVCKKKTSSVKTEFPILLLFVCFKCRYPMQYFVPNEKLSLFLNSLWFKPFTVSHRVSSVMGKQE